MSGGVHAATPVEDGLTHALWVLAASAIVALVARLALRASNALARVTVAADGSLLTPGGAAVAVLEELLQELQQFCAGHGLGGFVFGQALSGRPSSAQKARSCPALNELPNSDRAIDAYADALEEVAAPGPTCLYSQAQSSNAHALNRSERLALCHASRYSGSRACRYSHCSTVACATSR